jgi:hypothetical protein
MQRIGMAQKRAKERGRSRAVLLERWAFGISCAAASMACSGKAPDSDPFSAHDPAPTAPSASSASASSSSTRRSNGSSASSATASVPAVQPDTAALPAPSSPPASASAGSATEDAHPNNVASPPPVTGAPEAAAAEIDDDAHEQETEQGDDGDRESSGSGKSGGKGNDDSGKSGSASAAGSGGSSAAAAQPAAAASLGFVSDVWPIFNAQCGPCHVSGRSGNQSIGSTNLDTAFADAVRVGREVLSEIDSGGMPPACNGGSPGDPGCIASQSDLDTVHAWIAQGSPR